MQRRHIWRRKGRRGEEEQQKLPPGYNQVMGVNERVGLCQESVESKHKNGKSRGGRDLGKILLSRAADVGINERPGRQMKRSPAGKEGDQSAGERRKKKSLGEG